MYPLGISCECLLVYLAATSGDNLNPLISLAFKVILGVYIPGKFSFFLFFFLFDAQLTLLMADLVSRLLYPVYPYDGAETKGPESRGCKACRMIHCSRKERKGEREED